MSSEPIALHSGRLFKTDSISVGMITRLQSKEVTLQSMLGRCALLSSSKVWSLKKIGIFKTIHKNRKYFLFFRWVSLVVYQSVVWLIFVFILLYFH